MNRNLTNVIRFVMDDCLPPVIRDNRWFMYPFFYLAYRGKNIAQIMDFKSRVYDMSESEYNAFYCGLDSISRHRQTDLNEESVQAILEGIAPGTESLLDVGCGHGYLLKRIQTSHPHLHLTGCDVKAPADTSKFDFRQGQLSRVGFSDKQFDVVTCCHTLEHILCLKEFVGELLRITRKQLIIVVPCQRYYYYTLDEHVHFFQTRHQLAAQIPLSSYRCEKMAGDWVYFGAIE